ncbi:MAG: aminoglycoside 6'-N-acetyltransferase [Cyanobacteria bacterium P01_A01_bin.17]
MDASLPAELKISAVSSADFEDWFTLVLELWPEEEEADRKDMRKKMMASLEAENQSSWLVRSGAGEAIAFMDLSLRQDYVPGATQSPVAFVEGIYVRPAYRHQKVGTALIQWAQQWARQQGCVELASNTLIENKISYQFHTDVGFEEVERVVCFIKPLET